MPLNGFKVESIKQDSKMKKDEDSVKHTYSYEIVDTNRDKLLDESKKYYLLSDVAQNLKKDIDTALSEWRTDPKMISINFYQDNKLVDSFKSFDDFMSFYDLYDPDNKTKKDEDPRLELVEELKEYGLTDEYSLDDDFLCDDDYGIYSINQKEFLDLLKESENDLSFSDKFSNLSMEDLEKLDKNKFLEFMKECRDDQEWDVHTWLNDINGLKECLKLYKDKNSTTDSKSELVEKIKLKGHPDYKNNKYDPNDDFVVYSDYQFKSYSKEDLLKADWVTEEYLSEDGYTPEELMKWDNQKIANYLQNAIDNNSYSAAVQALVDVNTTDGLKRILKRANAWNDDEDLTEDSKMKKDAKVMSFAEYLIKYYNLRPYEISGAEEIELEKEYKMYVANQSHINEVKYDKITRLSDKKKKIKVDKKMKKDEDAKPELVKKIWDYIKEDDDSDYTSDWDPNDRICGWFDYKFASVKDEDIAELLDKSLEEIKKTPTKELLKELKEIEGDFYNTDYDTNDLEGITRIYNHYFNDTQLTNDAKQKKICDSFSKRYNK